MNKEFNEFIKELKLKLNLEFKLNLIANDEAKVVITNLNENQINLSENALRGRILEYLQDNDLTFLCKIEIIRYNDYFI